jgi:GH15 family glucan-1,4-alpha-glucosidase
MPVRDRHADVVRVVHGVAGRVEMAAEVTVRFDYGSTMPWVRRDGDALSFVAGPDALRLVTPIPLEGADFRHVARFSVDAGDAVPFGLTWYQSFHDEPRRLDPLRAVAETTAFWTQWSGRSRSSGPFHELVDRSVLTLKALTYAPTGGIVAAPTTSLPEWPGGVRNWDYRYCWLRDATFTLYSLMSAGYTKEATAFRDWLVRAVAGDPANLQIMYGPAGERRLPEWEVPWLPGFEASTPVRVGNAASGQFQLDVYGEVLDTMHQTRVMGCPDDPEAWAVQQAILEFLEGAWRRPDEGIWEVRGGRQHFTHSKVMAWVAFDRAVRAVRDHGLPGDADAWAAQRDEIHREVCDHGYDADRGAFVQAYGSKALDAATLLIPLVGFLPPGDPRVVSTVDAVSRELTEDGFVRRYLPSDVDGLPGHEGVFLPCSFWLVDALRMTGRAADADALLGRLAGLANDVGLLSEEYDPAGKRLLGNFPQAFTHVALVNSAHYMEGSGQNLGEAQGPAAHRARDGMRPSS